MTTIAEPVAKNGKAEASAAPRNLYQRLVEVKKSIGKVGKSAQAPPEMGGFRFVPWEGIADRIGDIFADHGVVMLPDMSEATTEQAGATRNGKPIYRTTARLMLTLVNADNPEDQLTLRWFGVGDDSSDKGLQKAATNGIKYLLMKLFLLGGAEDSDKETPERGGAPAHGAESVAPPQDHSGTPQAGGQCMTCARLASDTARDVRIGKYKVATGGPFQGQLQCTGKVDGNWANHLAPSEPFYDDTDVPF